jgi:hypothetical protein
MSNNNTNTNTNLINMFSYRTKQQQQPALALFTTNNVTANNNTVRLYKVGPSYTLIKIKNNRMYRVVGPTLIEILIHNIPSHWVCQAVFNCLTDGNLKALYCSFIGNNLYDIHS